MIELNSWQLLQLTLGVECAAMALIAGVFLLVLRATRRGRAEGWFWGWTFAAASVGAAALGQTYPAHQVALAYFAVVCAIGSGFCTAQGAFGFVRNGAMPLWAFAMWVTGAIAAVVVTGSPDGSGAPLLGPELALLSGLGLMSIALFPAARKTRAYGLQTACAVSILMTLMMSRTLISGALLNARHEQLNPLYWVFEAIAAGILAFVLAMGELIAILDEIRQEVEETNGALSSAMQNLEVAAKMDPLTGLHNRYAFYAVIADLRRTRTLDGSIVVLDLNGLKRINDTFGHYAGDRALRNVARRLQEVVRATDYVFRWGGDEFVILLFDVASDVARERLAHMESPEPLQLHGRQPIELTVSWGVAPLAYDMEAALKEADAQLYDQRRLIRSAAERITPA